MLMILDETGCVIVNLTDVVKIDLAIYTTPPYCCVRAWFSPSIHAEPVTLMNLGQDKDVAVERFNKFQERLKAAGVKIISFEG